MLKNQKKINLSVYTVATIVFRLILAEFRPKKYWNSDWFRPFSKEIQTYWDSPTGRVYDYVNFLDVAKKVQTNIFRELLETGKS